MDNSNDFNRILEELFVIIPRRMGFVADYLSRSTYDFEKIIDREQSLLDTMSGQVKMNQIKQSKPQIYDKTVLEVMGLSIERVNEDEKKLIKKKMGRNAHQYKDAYKVTNTKTQNKYDEYVNKHNINNSMLLWHGSRLENWWNICLTGLLLRPTNVVRTGAMFGHGIYFAPKCQKSIGYTSISGAYWTSGNSDTGFLALFEIAANKPYDIYTWHNWCSNLNQAKLQEIDKNINYVYAHAGNSLRNDDIIIYDENICTIKYLVEIKA